MLEIEKKRANEIDSKMNVSINLETGHVTLKTNEEDSAFEFGQQSRDVNEFLHKQNLQKQNQLNNLEDSKNCELDQLAQLSKLGQFTFKAATLTNHKDKKLYEALNIKEKPSGKLKATIAAKPAPEK